MKRTLFLLLACAGFANAGIGVNVGNQKVVHTDTVGGEEYQTVKIIDGTTGGTSSATVTSIGLKVDLTTTSAIIAGNFVNVTSTYNVTVGTFSDNGAAATGNRIPILPAIYQTSYLNGTAATQGRNAALSVGTDGLLWSANLPAIRPASFSASTGTITAAASATKIASICGNATNTVLVYHVDATCTETTAGNVTVGLFRSTQPYSGAWSTMTVVQHDTNYSVAISSAVLYSANPTVASTGGYVYYQRVGCMASATATANDYFMTPSDWRMKPQVLRGTNQCLSIDLLGVTVTGGAFAANFEWIETATITP